MTDTPRPELAREIATTANGIDITRGFAGPLLTPYDSVLRARGGNDLIIYEQVLSDPEVKATLSQRQLAVAQCEWQVDAGGDKRIDKQAAEFLRLQLHAIGWDNITTKMLFGVFYGYAVAEVIYKPDGARIVIDRIKVRNRRRFRYTPEGELRLLTPTSMTEGVPCEAPYFWDFRTGADNDDEPYGLGLAHWLYWPVLFKRNGIKFWLMFLEKFGMPTAVGKYDSDATDTERGQLLAATRAIQTDSGIIMPKGMEMSLLEAARSGTADYKTLHDTMDATIQKVVLGQTASTQGTAGKLGNDELQADVRDDIIKADADLVCESFNLGPARWLTEWNFPGAAIPRVYRVTEESADLDKIAERDERLARIGYKPTLARITQVFGEGYEPAAPAPATVPLAGEPAAAFAAPASAPDYVDLLVDALAEHGEKVTDDWLASIRSEVQAATDFDELLGRLSVMMTDLPLTELGELIAGASGAADRAGRADVKDETHA